MNLPESYLWHAVVKGGGGNLKCSWLFLDCSSRPSSWRRSLEKKLGDEWHAKDVMVAAHMNSVVQHVHEIHTTPDRWIVGSPFVIHLPEQCEESAINFERGTWHTLGMAAPQGQFQFQFVTTFFLTTVKEFSMKKVKHGLV